mmetsp:Transcript_19/g.53  ORF Transcript_19/g.53 Transcript_19/m.53 type:complete len:144 (+) Transcript_19:3-434(+)
MSILLVVSLSHLRHQPPALRGRRAAVCQLAAASSLCFGLGTGSSSAAIETAEVESTAAAETLLQDKTIGEIPASGIIFKDIVKVDRVSDPKVKGVQLYVSDFQRPITERLQGDFFGDPAVAAVTCVRSGKVMPRSCPAAMHSA